MTDTVHLAITDMQRASELVDEASGSGDYESRLIALALIARHFLRVSKQPSLVPCRLLTGDERPSNPIAASCGTLFDTYEEMAHHERKHEK